MVFRIFVEKKEPHNVEAKKIFAEIKNNLEIGWLKGLRVVNRYDVEGITEEIFEKAKHIIFSEPMADRIIDALPSDNNNIIFAVESLPGQYDQRADTCSQCIQILTEGIRPAVRTAKVYILETDSVSNINDTEKIKDYLINKVESREASLDEVQTLNEEYDIPYTVETFDGFINLNREELSELLREYSLAMDIDDILFCQDYFKNSENRDPTITEIRMIDTYWSDHCRHTTFLTEITDVEIENDAVKKAFENYLYLRNDVYGENKKNKSVTLMDIATIGAKYLKRHGKLNRLDESQEINACSVNIKVNINGRDEDYLLMFKNETHNHPTEIEPFGGAATCLGGAIRDPLSGRSYVYQAMRVTGAADPRAKVSETLKNKLPQSKITRTAADGFSSYGNQIGIASGGIYEVYHPNYVAKRMELGAVIGAAPKANVVREVPIPGDVIILLGGKTGRDGCGGATGSSKSHTSESLNKSGAEVQKGNPVEERKIQRLFRNSRVTTMIKRCNDFGAGGISVAIGELADSLYIDLSLVPKKYDGLDGTELAISESQERMAVVVANEHADAFIREASLENLEATKVAVVTNDNRLKMSWNGNQILSIQREFLNSNGAKKQTKIKVSENNNMLSGDIFNILSEKIKDDDIKQEYINLLSDLNICSQKGLVEQFDSSIGAGTVVSPFGGRHRLTPSQFMAAKIPVLHGDTDTSSVMAYGFSPYVSQKSPYLGAMYAVIESVSKLIAGGVKLSDIYLSLQEYFPRADSPEKFGLPFEALLGALEAQMNLEVAAIGGKDSMSGSYSFEDEYTGGKVNIAVPPTLVSFAAGTASADEIITNDFQKVNSNVYLLKPYYNEDGTINFTDLKNLYGYINRLMKEGMILSSYAVGYGGIGEAVFKMCVGSGMGFSFDDLKIGRGELFASYYGAFIVEAKSTLPNGELIGVTTPSGNITIFDTVMSISELTYKWLLPLEDIFPTEMRKINEDISLTIPKIEYPFGYSAPIPSYNSYQSSVKPRVFIPVFPGTNCEYDTAKKFNDAGGLSDIFVFRNLTSQAISESIDIFAQKIANSQIIALPGGFSAGDEPDGSAKFIVTIFRNPKIAEAVRNLLFVRNGLILGICNGFQALIKLGLLPYGDIKEVMTEDDPTLTFNRIGRHQSYVAYTRVASVKSPWFSGVKTGDVHAIPISHGEGRLWINDDKLNAIIKTGQIASQYCDLNGNPTMHPYYNPNSSVYAIEGLFSPDGRVFGKMGHSERNGKNVMKNIPGNKSQMIFASGVKYFK